MKKIMTFLKVSGLWVWIIYPVVVFLWEPFFRTEIPKWVSPVLIFILFFTNALICIGAIGKIRLGKKPSDIAPLEAFSTKPDEFSGGSTKRKYMYPDIPKSVLYDEPVGFCFGIDPKTKKYICKRIDEEGAVLVSGGSGTGKSSCFIVNYLLYCKGYDRREEC